MKNQIINTLFQIDTRCHEVEKSIGNPILRILFAIAYSPICGLHDWACWNL